MLGTAAEEAAASSAPAASSLRRIPPALRALGQVDACDRPRRQRHVLAVERCWRS